jgi:acyl-CoA thioester hydrolase
LTFPDTVTLAARAVDLGEDRFTMHYRVVSERLGVVAAEGEGRVISYDYRNARKAPLPPAIRAALIAFEGSGLGAGVSET